MRKMRIVFSVLVCISSLIFSVGFSLANDTNIYPLTGNAGIGTTSPRTNAGDTSYTTLDVRNTLWLGTPASQHGFINSQDSIFFNVDTNNSATSYFAFGTHREGSSGGTEWMRIQEGNVGIGVQDPGALLHLYKASVPHIKFTESATYQGHIALESSADGIATGTIAGDLFFGANLGRSIRFGEWSEGVNSNINMTIDPSGNVGIGTTSPGTGIKLDVVGKVRAHEIIVNLDNPADFVFEQNYNLLSLNQVESFIKENKHLPNLPSAKEVKENGIGVSEMMEKQMQKIEELTLYMIEQDKKIKVLEKELAELKEEK